VAVLATDWKSTTEVEASGHPDPARADEVIE
jgi:hypothetical protein